MVVAGLDAFSGTDGSVEAQALCAQQTRSNDGNRGVKCTKGGSNITTPFEHGNPQRLE